MRMSIIAASRLRAAQSNAFIMEVDTSKAGSASDAFQFTGAVGDYDVVAKQSGVAVETFSNLSGAQTITFSNGTGIYTLEVTPKATNGFNRINFNNSGDKLKITGITSWGNIAWSSFERAFFGCSNIDVTATNAPNLSSVSNMFVMFFNCTSLTNLDVTNWNVSNLINMSLVFRNCSSLTSLNVTNWNVSSVTNMSELFKDCSSLTSLNVTNWDVSSVTNMSEIFLNSSSLNPNASSWNVSNLSNMNRMFEATALSIANLDACYQNWSQLSLQSNVPFGAGTVQFTSAAQAGRDTLVNTYSWTVTDGGAFANPFIMEVDTSKAGSASDAFQFTGALGDYDVVAKQSGVAVHHPPAVVRPGYRRPAPGRLAQAPRRGWPHPQPSCRPDPSRAGRWLQW